MKVSIVTISYNQREYIQECVESVLAQKSSCSIEYIIVDGNSKDGTREYLTSIAGSIDVLIIEKDQGPADALRKGFEHASGDVLMYVNSDDKLEPDSVRTIIEYFRLHPVVDVVMGCGFIIDSQGHRIGKIIPSKFSVSRCLYNSVIFSQPSTAMRREAYCKSGGFNTSNTSCWDGELLVDLARAKSKFRRIPNVLSSFRLYPESITGSNRLQDQYKADLKRMFRDIKHRPYSNWDRYISIVPKIESHINSMIFGLRVDW